MTRVAVLVAMLLMVGCVPGAQLHQGPGILGAYVVNGVDPNGIEYTGRVSISAGDTPDDVVIEWVVTGAIIRGEGHIVGDTLTVDWVASGNPRGDSRGTAQYEITDDGHLIGTRALEGVDTPGTEEIFPEP